jgi:hypothetical protein
VIRLYLKRLQARALVQQPRGLLLTRQALAPILFANIQAFSP